MNMDPDIAVELVKHGATILLLDVPQHTFMGIDTQTFSVGPVFKGIKMIPPGPHFFYYSSSSKNGLEFAPVTGFFAHASASEIIVRQWDSNEERLVKVNEEEEERYRDAVRSFEFDRHLGPYNLSQYKQWKLLSSYLTKELTQRIEPTGGDITVAVEADRVGKRVCNYALIPRVIKNKDAKLEELTSMNIDKTKLLETILSKDFNGSEDSLVGELQFAFVAFLMGQSLEGFLQWKSLVTLLLGCTQAPFETRSQLFKKSTQAMYYQLKFGLQKESGSSGVFDELWLSNDIVLCNLFKEFILMVEESSVVDGDLLSWTRKLRSLLEKCFGWKFDHNYFEDDEFAPVVEMLDPTES